MFLKPTAFLGGVAKKLIQAHYPIDTQLPLEARQMDQKASEPRLSTVQENARANTNRANGASKQSTKAAASAAWSIP